MSDRCCAWFQNTIRIAKFLTIREPVAIGIESREFSIPKRFLAIRRNAGFDFQVEDIAWAIARTGEPSMASQAPSSCREPIWNHPRSEGPSVCDGGYQNC
ncbi:MAG TPA: hypothetical protein DIU35_17695 [Candidatus Latescibacteria bacterium]|nr:hypothetical protein [Candidatus Latescibacterota bacterium]|tara:strand:- start:446 stop:745 length:300 start_codon:yes stop_codon:yes gene_type:complete